MDESVLLVVDCGRGFTFGSGPDYIPDDDTHAMNWQRRRIATRAVQATGHRRCDLEHMMKFEPLTEHRPVGLQASA